MANEFITPEQFYQYFLETCRKVSVDAGEEPDWLINEIVKQATIQIEKDEKEEELESLKYTEKE